MSIVGPGGQLRRRRRGQLDVRFGHGRVGARLTEESEGSDVPGRSAAMAELSPDDLKTGAIANVLGVKVSSLGPVRKKLIDKGMIFSPAHGDMAFTVPLFDEFMRRAIPHFEVK